MLNLIIFDMDGVIVDSEFVGFSYLQKFVEQIKQRTTPISHEEYSAIIGRSYDDLYLAIKDLSQSNLSIKEIGIKLGEFSKQHLSNIDYFSIFRKDILHIIQFAKQNNIKLALASSSEVKRMEQILADCGIRQYFDYVVSGTVFPKSKPHPEIYQHVLAHFNLSADQAIAIEDSSLGIESAKGAGIKVIAYEENRMAMDQSLADYKGKDMQAILAIIQHLYSE
ncbi:HAD family hydrolase [Otariodibacter oris]|uniref:phosphoglycolate phosphatase n=1 Tax=Otariodibacter oris TaxID=1032623 RepID=A0A420XHI9_9PAST|nr:HAD family phosphatase [Otariodibacter oris]QGM81070.1 hypothetical protein A6A10_06455 [Otariodibacter oris]RKR76743.1 HAD superfamily hydrolase (TIGR01509 family)/HAD superfamily hydrolase (TIGR01549 family) [Otariodibacter oris]